MQTVFPHHIGHYLGLDIHDTPTLSFQKTLVPGMVVTVEPGLYFPNDSSFPEKLVKQTKHKTKSTIISYCVYNI